MQKLKAHIKDQMKEKKHIVWDWNGTLLDDVDMVVGAITTILSQHNLPVVTREQYREVFGFPVIHYYKKLGFDFEKETFESLSEKFVSYYMREILNCELHIGAFDLLHEFKASGISQSILTAAHEHSLLKHLDHFKIRSCFDRVYGLSDHHAKSKVERGLELIRDSGYTAEDTVLIGDTDHDLEVGKAMGVDVILLGDGHQTYERLSQVHSVVLMSR